jgi:hypothetical protein
VTDADQRPKPTDSAAAEEPGNGVPDAATTGPEQGVSAGDAQEAQGAHEAPPAAPESAGTPAAEPNPYAPPQEDLPPQPNPWGPPPAQPYGQVKPGPVQPWGTQRPREPERPTGQNWGDPNRYGQIQPPDRNDPDRRYKDQREQNTQRPARPQRDLPTRWALGLSMGALICTMLALYQGMTTFPAWMIGAGAGLALSVGAIVMAIRAQRVAARTGKRAPEATMSIVSACLSGILALIVLVTSIVWFGQLKEYAKCMQGANTQVAQNICLTQLEDSTGMSVK